MIDVYGVTNLVATANQIRDLLDIQGEPRLSDTLADDIAVGGGIIATAFVSEITIRVLPARRYAVTARRKPET